MCNAVLKIKTDKHREKIALKIEQLTKKLDKSVQRNQAKAA